MSQTMKTKGESLEPGDEVAALASLARLRSLSVLLEKHEAQISTLQGALTSKTAVLEDIRSEKRILQAEREEVIRRLMSIQQDLEDIAAMETKITLETGKFENELNQRFQDEQYVETRQEVAKLRSEHNLPELAPLARTREEESARYLQSRLNERRHIHQPQS